MDVEHLLCAQLCFRNWRYTGEQARRGPCPTKGRCLEKLSGKAEVCTSQSWRGRGRKEGRRCQRERWHGRNRHVKEALRVFQGGRERGCMEGTDGQMVPALSGQDEIPD